MLQLSGAILTKKLDTETSNAFGPGGVLEFMGILTVSSGRGQSLRHRREEEARGVDSCRGTEGEERLSKEKKRAAWSGEHT